MSLDPHWTLSFGGDFWTKDVKATLAQNVRSMLVALAVEGEQDVKDHFPVGGSGDPHSGLGQSGVVGRVASLSGSLWHYTAVISQQAVYPWGQHAGVGRGGAKSAFAAAQLGVHGLRGGTSGNEQYRGGKLERKLHMFANTANRIKSMRAILSADLTKGLGN